MNVARYISIVATGRNDGYRGDFAGRFLRTLEFNARQLGDRGVAWEILFVAWAPLPGRPHVYRARRIGLTLGIDESSIDWDILEDDRNYDGGTKALKPPVYSGGTGDFVLLDASAFAELRGFNEVYRVAKIGIDRNFLVKALHSDVPITDVGGPVYHVNHVGSYRGSTALYQDRQAEAPYGDRRWGSGSVVYENPEDWGLARAPMEQMSHLLARLHFDRAAVPPLMEHHRVVASTIGMVDGESV